MALRLRSNPAPLNGALFVSNPRRKKNSSSKRRKRAVSKVRKNRKNPVRKNRRNPIKLKKNGLVVKKNRKNGTKKGQVRKTARKAYARKRKNGTKKGQARKTARRAYLKRRKNSTKKGGVRKTARRAYMKRRKNSTKKGGVRKTARRAYMKRRKNGTKKGQSRKTARRAYSKRKNSVRIVRKNPLSLAFLKPVEKLVSKIPVIGKKIAPYTQPAVVSMVGGASVVAGMQYVGKIPYVGEYAKYPFGHAFGYTVMGLGLAVVSAFLPVKPATKKTLAMACAVAGGAINAGQLAMNGFDLQAVKEQNLDQLGASDLDSLLAEDSVAGLGDGMYYEVEPLSGLVADMSGLDYDSAQLGDACSCPHDLSAEEGKVAVQGRDAYLRKFGSPPKKMAGQKSFQSIMAGRHGHRWGWLIKSLGYARFKQLASLPPSERKIMIAKLKASAIQASQTTFDSELTGALSGLDYNLDMSGLSIDGLSGLAVTGAGI